jgi:Transposase DDE domain
MIRRDSLLVTLLKLVDRVPMPSSLPQRGKGRPKVYADRLFLKAVVIMIVRPRHRVHELLSVLNEPTAEMCIVRALLTEAGRFPTRRTWERRLNALPHTLPAPIGCMGRCVVTLIDPWATYGRAVAIDSTILRATGGVWHKKHREQGVVPPTAMDTEAHWTTSGWQGWVYGWKLHLVTGVAAVWSPVAADLTAANQADHEIALRLLPERPPEARFVLGDTAYADPALHQHCAATGRLLITPGRGPYPHADDGVEVRRLFHQLRSLAIENFNEQCKGMCDGHGQVPTKGLSNTRRFALGAIFVSQLVLGYRFEHGLDLRVGLKAFLKAA